MFHLFHHALDLRGGGVFNGLADFTETQRFERSFLVFLRPIPLFNWVILIFPAICICINR